MAKQRKLNRVTPRLDARHMQTFQIVAPKSTHTRVATCEEVECKAYKNGWRTTLDLGTDLGQKQAHYIKNLSGRSYKIVGREGNLVMLEFRAAQPCFAEHRVPTGRPELFRVKGGDFRGNPLRTPVRTHTKPEHWVEEFAENQERIRSAIEKG